MRIKRRFRRFKFLFSVILFIIPFSLVILFSLSTKNYFISKLGNVENLIKKDSFSHIYNKSIPKIGQESEKLDIIRKEMLFAWSKYKKYCWGKGELKPLSKKCDNEMSGLTMIDSLSTLWVMGLHKEFNESRDYINNDFILEGTWSTFEVIIRFLGGYLSAYQLSDDKVFFNKAVELGNALCPLVNLTNGDIFDEVTLHQTNGKIIAEGYGESDLIAEKGTIQLEFLTLYYITNDEKFFNVAFSLYKSLWKKNPGISLFTEIESNEKQKIIRLSGGYDSYYEYIIKTYILTGQKSDFILEKHKEVVKAIREKCLFKSNSLNITSIGWRINDRIEYIIDHLATFAAGMIAIGSVSKNENAKEDLKLSLELVDGYYKIYSYFPGNIGPETSHIYDKRGVIMPLDNRYLLRPETVESIYIAWKLTGDPIYRFYNWKIFQSIVKYCKTKNGYAGNLDVTNPSMWKNDKQESFFLSETLKYIYLTFESNSFLSLDQWVFNTEAHPLKIWDSEFSSENSQKINKMFV